MHLQNFYILMSCHHSPLNKKHLRDLAAEVFGKEHADAWMNSSNILLNGKSPSEVLHTTKGKIELERILKSIQYGGLC